MSSFALIMIPICVTRSRANGVVCNHWMLLVANTATQSVSILNSVPNARSFACAAETYVAMFR
jgi:hypothetical protein